MKKVPLLILLLVFSNIVNAAYAGTTTRTVTASTGEIDLAAGIKIELLCQYNIGVTTPEKVNPGKDANIDLNIYSGSWTVRVFVPSPVNEWFSRDFDLSFSGYITITPGLSVNLDVSPVATIVVSGPASLSGTDFLFDNRVYWSGSSGDKVVTIRCSEGATHGNTITFEATFAADVTLGVNIDLALFRQNVADFELTRIQMSPRISERITVDSPFGNMLGFVFSPLGFVVGSFFLLILLIVFGAYRAKKKRDSNKMATKPKQTTPKPAHDKELTTKKQNKYCIYCGEKLPDEATFCGNCGKPRK